MLTKKHVLKTATSVSTPFKSGHILMGLSGLLGGLSLVLFGAFIYAGLPRQLHLGLGSIHSLLLNTLLCVCFFFQHSLMVRVGFRKRLARQIPDAYHGAIFSILSGVSLVLVMLFWQKTPSILLEFDGARFWIMRGLFLLSIVGFYTTARSLKTFDPFGLRDISTHMAGKTSRASAFVVQGSYRWVRHPLYSLFLILIWTPVSVTADRLLFNILWTGWIVTGTILEERDLVALFGQTYRNYQRNVPMLIPYKGRCHTEIQPHTTAL